MGAELEPPMEACTKPLFYSVRRSQHAGGAGTFCILGPSEETPSQADYSWARHYLPDPSRTREHSLQLLLPAVLALQLDQRSLRNIAAVVNLPTMSMGITSEMYAAAGVEIYTVKLPDPML
jgi:hypothetical protein